MDQQKRAKKEEKIKMTETYSIPMKFKEGVYGIKDFENVTENVLEFHYQEYGEIVTYELPGQGYNREINMYSIPRNVLEETLKATYGVDGQLKKITIAHKNKEMLLYIHYESEEEIRNKMQSFAIENANSMIEKICMCKDTVSRLFIEYFKDGDCVDFHAKIGTEAQKIALEKKYPDCDDIADYCGDYNSEMIYGDNDRLKIMVLCANNEETNYFPYVVDIMAKHIKENAVEKLNKATDFKFLCMDYD